MSLLDVGLEFSSKSQRTSPFVVDMTMSPILKEATQRFYLSTRNCFCIPYLSYMKEQKKILESYLREIILSELKIKDSFKRDLKRSWNMLKNSVYNRLEKIGVDTRSLKKKDYYDYDNRFDFSGYSHPQMSDETGNLIKRLVNSWYSQVSEYSNINFSSEDKKKAIESCKKIYKNSLYQGENPQQAMDKVFKYLAKVSR